MRVILVGTEKPQFASEMRKPISKRSKPDRKVGSEAANKPKMCSALRGAHREADGADRSVGNEQSEWQLEINDVK